MDMDVNDLRSIVTVLSLLAFAGIVAWAYSRANRARFDEAAQLPFADEGSEANLESEGRP
jgi:cytochrome c oxidase cbb3-type subunit IV